MSSFQVPMIGFSAAAFAPVVFSVSAAQEKSSTLMKASPIVSFM